MGLVAEGLDNKEIAARLYLSEGTVRNHISAILQKLALKNRTQLAIAFYRGVTEGRDRGTGIMSHSATR